MLEAGSNLGSLQLTLRIGAGVARIARLSGREAQEARGGFRFRVVREFFQSVIDAWRAIISKRGLNAHCVLLLNCRARLPISKYLILRYPAYSVSYVH